MRLRPGAEYYANRIYQEQPVLVMYNGIHAVVTRATPRGRHIPAQAHIMWGDDEHGWHERWVPAKELERAS